MSFLLFRVIIKCINWDILLTKKRRLAYEYITEHDKIYLLLYGLKKDGKTPLNKWKNLLSATEVDEHYSFLTELKKGDRVEVVYLDGKPIYIKNLMTNKEFSKVPKQDVQNAVSL